MKKPLKIYSNVSHGQLSLARHYGGIKVNGEDWQYDYANDTLFPRSRRKEYVRQMAENENTKTPQFEPTE